MALLDLQGLEVARADVVDPASITSLLLCDDTSALSITLCV